MVFHCLSAIGIAKTNEINLAAVRSMSDIEIRRLKTALGLDKDHKVSSFEEFKDCIGKINDLVMASFMKFNAAFPEENVMTAGFEPGECFAYQGISRLGAIDEYRCGIMLRPMRWLEGLGLEFTMEPELGRCIMHTQGQCAYKFSFTFQDKPA